MFERFTEKAIKTVLLAQEESRRLGHNFVGTEQILLGLIGEGTGIAAKILKKHGVTYKDARVEVEKIIGRGGGFVAVEIPFTPRCKRILELSWQEARKMRVNYISTEHLLLGLIAENDGVAIRVLENMKVNLESLKQAVLRLAKLKTGSFASSAEAILSTCDYVISCISSINSGLVKINDDVTAICKSQGINRSDAEEFQLALKKKLVEIQGASEKVCVPEAFDFSQETDKIQEWIEKLE